MITINREFMERLAAIQNGESVFTTLPSDEPRFIIDANERTITIPEEFSKFLAVKGDHRAETVYFEIDRYFDDVDLSNKTCIIQFQKPGACGSYEGICPVTEYDIESVEGKIIFGWEITNDVTDSVADVLFSIRFYSIEDGEFSYNFNTIPARSRIVDSINVRTIPVAPLAPSTLQKWFDAINNIALNVTDDNNGNVKVSFK